MSFKLFIYYSALCGGWAAVAGWLIGQILAPEDSLPRALIQGLTLGMFVSLGVGLVDALWTVSGRSSGQVWVRGLVVAAIGSFSGLVGAGIGQFVVLITNSETLGVLGWTLMGLLIGASVGVFDVAARFVQGQDMRGARRKILNGVLGGVLGGLLGSILHALLGLGLAQLFQALGRPANDLKSTSLWGFVILGTCIGLFIGLAQVILKEAWVRVEVGFRAGRELILSKPETTIGRAESCDIGLFGDGALERTHARIVHQGNRYLVDDAQTPGGTFVNDERVTQPRPLRSGDLIRLGNSVLRFGERQKRR